MGPSLRHFVEHMVGIDSSMISSERFGDSVCDVKLKSFFS